MLDIGTLVLQEVEGVDEAIRERILEMARYILQTQATVRQVAAVYGISKSTVHKDISERLPQLHPGLAMEVRELMEYNKSVRHLRGGEATKRKYLALQQRQQESDAEMVK